MFAMLAGIVVMAFAVIGLFFLRFWKESRDRLFLYFSLAFFILALNRAGLALTIEQGPRTDAFYWVRFLAFALILVAIIDKNRSRKTSKR